MQITGECETVLEPVGAPALKVKDNAKLKLAQERAARVEDEARMAKGKECMAGVRQRYGK